MENDDDWGPWIEHDGSGFPVPIGTLVHRVFDNEVDFIGGKDASPTREIIDPLRQSEEGSWDWSKSRRCHLGTIPRVVRYRIRRSAAFKSLQKIAETPDRETIEA